MAILSVLLLGPVLSRADNGPEPSPLRATHRKEVEARYRQNLAQYGNDTNFLVRPGVLADRRARRVVIQAEASPLNAQDPVEFFLIGEGSGKEYESLAVALARPGHVYQALTFIGLTPGRPVAPDQLCFWPKGERVHMSFRLPGRDSTTVVAAEDLVLDSTGRKSLPPAGLVFVGGPITRAETDSNIVAYAVDVGDPGSIASLYNEPITVLDVPRQAAQSEVYGQQIVNDQVRLPGQQMVEVILEPEGNDDRTRVMDLDLAVALSAATSNATLANVTFRLTERTGRKVGENVSFDAIRSVLGVLAAGNRDAFVTARFDDALPLRVVRAVCAELLKAEDQRLVRMEPPPAGQLYYKAFLPREDFRNRTERLMQPWELHLAGASAAPTGTLVQIEEVWKDDQPRPDLKVTDHAVASGADLRARLEQFGPGLRVILVYAPASLSYGALMRFVSPALTTHPTVHVFLE
jgi:hypothetical protein